MSLEIRPGERLALVGENGAGKSSLMNVLYGLYRPDAGEVSVEGRPVELRSPKDAIALGVGMVHQHFMLVPSLTVTQNVVLGCEPTRLGVLDRARARSAVAKTCERFHFALDPDAKVGELTVGSQQKVEIVKALHRGAKTLILDEPTAVLTPQEAQELFSVVRELSAAGHSVVLISHKLREVLEVAHRIVVMRRGRVVAERAPSQTGPEELAALMVGEAATSPPAPAAPASPPGECVLRLRKVTALRGGGRPALDQLSLEVRAGELVGIAGVDGNGQRELAEVVTGLRPFGGGELEVGGRLLPRPTPGELRAAGVAHVPEDRLMRAIVPSMSVEENAALGRQARPPFAKGALIDFPGRRRRTQELIDSFDVRPKDPALPIGRLSGGNQQKVVVARELDGAPRLLVAVQPTRGLDVAAVATVHARLLDARSRGCAVLLVSLDLEELLALSDRVYVLFEGRVRGEVARGQYDELAIGRMMLGAEPRPDQEGAA